MIPAEVDILITASRGVAFGGRRFRPGERALVTRGEALMLRRYGLACVLRYIAAPAAPAAVEDDPDRQ